MLIRVSWNSFIASSHFSLGCRYYFVLQLLSSFSLKSFYPCVGGVNADTSPFVLSKSLRGNMPSPTPSRGRERKKAAGAGAINPAAFKRVGLLGIPFPKDRPA